MSATADAMALAVEHLRTARLAVVAARGALDNAIVEVGGMGDRLRSHAVCPRCRGAKTLCTTSSPAGFAGAQQATVRCPGCNGTGWEG